MFRYNNVVGKVKITRSVTYALACLLVFIVVFYRTDILSEHRIQSTKVTKQNLSETKKFDLEQIIMPTPSPSTIAPPPTTENSLITPTVGIAINGLRGMSEHDMNIRFKDIQSLGFTWIRTDFHWPTIQPNDSKHYDWKNYDTIVKVASSNNLKVLGILDYTPPWARQPACANSDKCAPANPTDFAVFAGMAADRYKTTVAAWEIWNEPNSYHFWLPEPNSRLYADLLKQSYTAIKTASPLTPVLVGASDTSSDGPGKIDAVTLLRELYSLGSKNYFDAVGYHPYTFTFPETSFDSNLGWARMASSTNNLYAVMNTNGDGNKKIWMTEFGAPTNGPASSKPVSENSQAELAQQVYNEIQYKPWAGPLFWYTYRDAGTSTSTKENFFGIKRADGSNKPAYEMWRQLLIP